MKKKHISLLQWQIAFKRLAIAMHAANMWEFSAALEHEDIVLQVAASANLGRRKRTHAARKTLIPQQSYR